jgi:hypothetical protein
VWGPGQFVISRKSAEECNASIGVHFYVTSRYCVLLHGKIVQMCESFESCQDWIVNTMKGIHDEYAAAAKPRPAARKGK